MYNPKEKILVFQKVDILQLDDRSIEGLENIPYWFVPRGEAEECDSLVQPIPYIVVMTWNLNGYALILNYRRTTGEGDSRLYGARSVGFGGHINVKDDKRIFKKTVESAANRELEEEIYPSIDFDAHSTFMGFLYFATNEGRDAEVSSKHLGLLYVVTVPYGEFYAKDPAIGNLKWTHLGKLVCKECLSVTQPGFERWSEESLKIIRENCASY